MAGLWTEIKGRWFEYTMPWGAFCDGAKCFILELFSLLLSGHISSLFHPSAVADKSFVRFFKSVGHHFYRMEQEMAVPRLVGSAQGVILELGPCTGNQVPRFDKTKVSHIYGIEPNSDFKDILADRVRENGLEDRYSTVWERFEDAAPQLEKLGVRRGEVDSIVIIQVMCSVDDPERVVRECWNWLKPGGELLFLEHVGSKDPMTRVAQRLWDLVWPFVIGGCTLTKNSDKYLSADFGWEVEEFTSNEFPRRPLMPRIWGRLRKPRDA